MSGKQYWKNKIPYVTGNFLAMAVLAVFLLLGGKYEGQRIVYSGELAGNSGGEHGSSIYVPQKTNGYIAGKRESAGRKISDCGSDGALPERADDRVFYQVMKAAEKSMLERIGNMQREQKEYREYIEQWVHEMKTPITAMKLLCENHLSEFTRQFPVELEKSNRLTEQVLSTQILTITVILLLLFACYFISTWILFRKSVTEIS